LGSLHSCSVLVALHVARFTPASTNHSFLGYVDLLGTTYDAPTLATGFGAAIATPLMREAYEAKAGIDGKGELLTQQEAEELMDECMKVLFYRDARSINKVSTV
jgi:20S proteasome subunit beta 7